VLKIHTQKPQKRDNKKVSNKTSNQSIKSLKRFYVKTFRELVLIAKNPPLAILKNGEN
jgi:hypothetical protein